MNAIKSIIKDLIRLSISMWYCEWNPLLWIIKKWENISHYMYSQKYCVLFNCHNVWFKKPFNNTRGEQYFHIGEETSFGKMTVLTAWDEYEGETFLPEVIIGKNCSFGDYLHLTCIKKITIGNHVLTGRWVTISDNGHGNTDYETLQMPPTKRKLSCKGPVEIGNNVWIGDKATILSGVKIGEGSVIAANAVVTKEIPSFCVAAGNPAKIIKQNIIKNEQA